MPAVQLHPGEKIIFQGHPSWRAIMGFYIKGIIAALVIGAIIDLVGVGTASAVLIGIILIGLTVLAGFIRRWATVYTITNRRLNIKRGIISRDIQETRLERVQNVNYHQSVYQRLLYIGDVEFDTAGSDESNFFFYGVAEPAEVVHQVDVATGADAAGPQGLGQAAPAAREDSTSDAADDAPSFS